MIIDPLGIPIYSEKDIVELFYSDNTIDLNSIFVDLSEDELKKFNMCANDLGTAELKKYQPINLTIDQFDTMLQNDWLMPEEYKQLDIEKWITDQGAPWDPEASRIAEELAAFKERNMLNLLRWLKYFVDTCRANNVVWGVGRGSSVASYVLFLLGVHKIDSIKYNLDWREFLR